MTPDLEALAESVTSTVRLTASQLATLIEVLDGPTIDSVQRLDAYG